jgi:PKD repeat protein
MVMVTGGTGSYSYSWNTVPAQTTATASGLTGGTYTVTTTDANGCTDIASVTLTEPAEVIVTVAGDDTICSGQSTTLTASGATTYVWDNAATTAAIVASPTATTTYTVTGDVNGCTDTEMFVVEVLTPVTAGFTYTANDLTIDFTNTSAGAATYSWDFGDGTTETTANASHLYATAGTYNVVMIASNECSSDTATQTIIVTSTLAASKSASLNVFPNPSKDVFNIRFTDNQSQTVKVKIMAANGQVVMEENIAQFSGTYVNQVNMKQFAKGVYTLQITTDNSVMTRRVVLN